MESDAKRTHCVFSRFRKKSFHRNKHICALRSLRAILCFCVFQTGLNIGRQSDQKVLGQRDLRESGIPCGYLVSGMMFSHLLLLLLLLLGSSFPCFKVHINGRNWLKQSKCLQIGKLRVQYFWSLTPILKYEKSPMSKIVQYTLIIHFNIWRRTIVVQLEYKKSYMHIC